MSYRYYYTLYDRNGVTNHPIRAHFIHVHPCCDYDSSSSWTKLNTLTSHESAALLQSAALTQSAALSQRSPKVQRLSSTLPRSSALPKCTAYLKCSACPKCNTMKDLMILDSSLLYFISVFKLLHMLCFISIVLKALLKDRLLSEDSHTFQIAFIPNVFSL